MISKEKRREISLRSLNNPENRKRHTEYNKKRRQAIKDADYPKYMLDGVIRNAKRTGREVTITKEDIVIPDLCPVLGIPLRRDCSRKDRDAAPSIDRIDNSVGYTPENIIVVSMRANQIKGTATTEELEKVLNFYKLLLAK